MSAATVTLEAHEQQKLFNALQHRRLAEQRRANAKLEQTRALIAEDLHRARAALLERDSMAATLDAADRRHDARRRFTPTPVAHSAFGPLEDQQ